MLMLLPKIEAQTVSATTVNSSISTVRGVGNDLKKKKYRDAAGRVLDNKEVKKRVKVDDKTRSFFLDAGLRSKITKAKSDFRRDPVGFSQKHEKEYRLLKKYRPKWLRRNTRRSRRS